VTWKDVHILLLSGKTVDHHKINMAPLHFATGQTQLPFEQTPEGEGVSLQFSQERVFWAGGRASAKALKQAPCLVYLRTARE
jgi:hypothetical protein